MTTRESPTSKGPPPEITPQVLHLIDVLKRAREGRLRVPEFQRDYVWKRQDIIDLFDSVTNQYPIGTLFLWGTNPLPHSRRRIGPLKVPDYKGETFLVLDGQQRLTTLVGILLADDEKNWEPEDSDSDPQRWRLYFDARNQEFTHGDANGPDADAAQLPVYYVPLPSLLDTMKLFQHAQRMTKALPEQSRAEVDEWIKRAQEVGQAIQRYRIPIVEIKTDSLSIAVESFSRLNKKGRKVSADEMFSALTYESSDGKQFHLASRIDQLQLDMIRSGFGQVDRTALLRAVLTATAELDIYRTDWTRLSRDVQKGTREKLPQAVEVARLGLGKARAFLRDLGVLNARMLPYSMQLVALSGFFGRCPAPSPAQLALLRRWFWSSSFVGWFGTANPAQVRRLVDEMRDTTATDKEPTGFQHMDIEQTALPTPLRFDLRSARVRALLCLLLARKPRRPDGTQLSLQEAADLLLQRGPDAMSVVCATVRDSDLRSSPANRILDLAPDIPGQAKNWLTKLPAGQMQEILDSHAIPVDAFAELCRGNNDKFLQLRLNYLVKLEREYLNKERIPPSKFSPVLAPLDEDGMAPLDENGQLFLIL